MPNGSSAHFCSMGTANATVFPVPVFDPPMQSLPLSISGIQDLWISVGFVMAMELREWTSHGETSRDSNEESINVDGAEEGIDAAGNCRECLFVETDFLILDRVA